MSHSKARGNAAPQSPSGRPREGLKKSVQKKPGPPPLDGSMLPPPDPRPTRPSSVTSSASLTQLTPMSRRRDASPAQSECQKPLSKQQRKESSRPAQHELKRHTTRSADHSREGPMQCEPDSRHTSCHSRSSVSNRSTSRPSQQGRHTHQTPRSRTRTPRTQAEDLSRNASRERWDDCRPHRSRRPPSPARSMHSKHSSRQNSRHSQDSIRSRKGNPATSSLMCQDTPQAKSESRPRDRQPITAAGWGPRLRHQTDYSTSSHRGYGS
jgi:hypothetical protein